MSLRSFKVILVKERETVNSVVYRDEKQDGIMRNVHIDTQQLSQQTCGEIPDAIHVEISWLVKDREDKNGH